jgi:hypothetical protein
MLSARSDLHRLGRLLHHAMQGFGDAPAIDQFGGFVPSADLDHARVFRIDRVDRSEHPLQALPIHPIGDLDKELPDSAECRYHTTPAVQKPTGRRTLRSAPGMSSVNDRDAS